MADCSNLLGQLLLVSSRQELDALIDSSQDCFTRPFLQSAAKAIEDWLETGEPNAWQIWPVLEYALNRGGPPVMRGDLAALWAEAERKYKRGDFIPHYEQALQYYRAAGAEALGQSIVCLRNLALAYSQRGNLTQAESHYQEALDLATSYGLPLDRIKSLSELGKLAQRRGDISAAKQYFEGALQLCEQEADEAGAIAQLNHLGAVHFASRHIHEAELTFNRALERARTTGSDRLLAMSLGNLASVLHEQGRAREAETVQAEAREYIEQVGEIEWLGNWWKNFGLFAMQGGRLHAAVERLNRAISLYHEAEDPGGEASATGHLADVWWRLGEVKKSHSLYEHALSISMEAGAITIVAEQHIGLGTIAQIGGDLSGAAKHFESANLIFSNAGLKNDETRVTRLLAGVDMDSGDTEKAMEIYQALLTEYEFLGEPRQVAHILNDFGTALQEVGRTGEALVHYQRALETYRLYSDHKQTVVVLGNMGGAYQQRGETEQAIQALQEARELAERLGLVRAEAGLLSNLGMIWRVRGDTQNAIHLHQQAVELARRSGDTMVELEALNGLSGILYEVGETSEALELNAEVVSRTEKIGLARLRTLALINRGFIRSEAGQFQEGELDMLHGLELAKLHQILPLQIFAHRNIGTFYQTLGLLVEAQSHYEAALNLAREIGARRNEAEALGNLGNEAYERGDFTNSLNFHRAAFDLYTSLNDRRGQAIEMINLGNVALENHEDAVALRLYGQALHVCLDIGFRIGKALAVLGQGHIYFRAGDDDLAEKCYREASNLLAEIHQPEPQRVAITNLGLLAERRGNVDAAQEYYLQAIEMIELGRHNVAREEPRISYLGRRLTPYECQTAIYCRKGHIGAGFMMMERTRARTLIDLLEQALISMSEVPPELAQIKELISV